jgi:ferredoxin
VSLVDRLLSLFTPEAPAARPVGVASADAPVREAAARLGAVTDGVGEALGLALGGTRVTCFADAAPLLSRHMPMVVVAPAPLPGALLELRPRDAQEALHLLVLGHAVSAAALLPCVLVWTDHEAEVAMPSPAASRWLGAAPDVMPTPTEGQRIVFDDESRRRIPRWYDLDRPVLVGPHGPPAGVRSVATEVWFVDALPELIEQLRKELEAELGRPVGQILSDGKGDVAVVAAGLANGSAPTGTRLVRLAITRPAVGLSEVIGEGGRLVVVDDAIPSEARGPSLAPGETDLGPLLARLGDRKETPRFVGVEVVAEQAASPHRAALDAKLRRARPESETLGVASPAGKGHEASAVVPAIVRSLGDTGRGYDSVARFWTEVGQPLTRGLPPTADPYQALDVLPPRTAGLRDRSRERTQLPAFDPQKCTGCGACWAACPDSALHALALEPEAILGDDAALRPLSKSLRAALVEALDDDAGTAGEALSRAGDVVLAKLPEARAASARSALEARIEAVGAVQLAHTSGLGDSLLALAVDPGACSACGACSDACDDEAMLPLPQDDRVDEARARREAFDALPDTTVETLQRLQREAFDPLALLLLTRACSMALAGGVDGPSGDKRVIRALVAVTEARRQPRVHQQLRDLATLRSKLDEQITAELTRILPTDAGALADALAGDAVVDGVAKALGQIDQKALHDKALLAHRLGQLSDTLPERARFGLVLTSGVAQAACRYPYNPFGVPVAVADDPDEILGLVRAQVARAVEEAGTARGAKDAGRGRRPETTALPESWQDLEREERANVPPVVVITDVAPPAALLDSGLPIKVLLLVSAPDGGQAESLLALSRRGTFTVQSAIGEAEDLVQAIGEALEHDGPALMRVLSDPDESWPLLRFAASSADPLVAEARRLADAAVAAAHAEELASLKAAHAEEVAALRSRVETEMAQRVHQRLLQLAGYGQGRD